MIGRIVRPIVNVVRAVWRATGGRLFGGAGQNPPREPVAWAERPEPQSVAGITLRASLVVVAVALALVLAYQLRLLMILVFLAILFAAGLYGPSVWFERRGLPRVVAVLLTYMVLIGVFALAIYLIFPPLVAQAATLAEDLPSLVEMLRQRTSDFIDQFGGQGAGDRVIDSVTAGAQEAMPDLSAVVQLPLTIAGILVNVFVIFILSAFVLLERDGARDWLLRFVDGEDQAHASNVGQQAILKLGAYVRGQLAVMTVIGVGSAAGMFVLGVPFAVPLGALSFLGAAIPMAGAFIAGVPIVLIALIDGGPLTAGLMAAWIVGLQQLEGYLITPMIQGRAVQLSPMVVFVGVLAGASLGGIVGAIIAIPLVAVADVVMRDVVFPLRRRAEERRAARLGRQEHPAL
ncbi:MAG: AI-2E family transporter [Candidatus Limnocylindria bacterium]